MYRDESSHVLFRPFYPGWSGPVTQRFLLTSPPVVILLVSARGKRSRTGQDDAGHGASQLHHRHGTAGR